MKRKAKKIGHHKDRAGSEALLLDAAKKVFSEHGFAAATTRMIAQKSGINMALIGRYFKGKYGLLEAVLERDLIANQKAELNYEPQKDLQSEALAYAEYNFKRQAADAEYIKIVISQFLTDRKFAKKFHESSLLVSNARFENRITPHLVELGVTNVADIQRFVSRIDTYVVDVILYGLIIQGLKESVAEAEVKNWVKEFCEMYVHFQTTKMRTK